MLHHPSPSLVHAPDVSAADLRRRLSVTDHDLLLVRLYGSVIVHRLDEFVRHFYAWLELQPEFSHFFSDGERLSRVQRQQTEHWHDFFSGTLDDEYVARRRRIGDTHARIGLSLAAYLASVDVSLTILLDRMYDGRLEKQAYIDCQRAVTKMIHADAIVIVDAYTRMTQRTLTEQTRALMEMSTPVTQLWDSILVLPVVGIVDSQRADDIMTSSLRRIAETRAKVFIIDVSGVSVIDTAVANHILKVTHATRLMGCQSVLSGVSPIIARTMVELGIDVGSIETSATLRDALERAFRTIGVMVVPVPGTPTR